MKRYSLIAAGFISTFVVGSHAVTAAPGKLIALGQTTQCAGAEFADCSTAFTLGRLLSQNASWEYATVKGSTIEFRAKPTAWESRNHLFRQALRAFAQAMYEVQAPLCQNTPEGFDSRVPFLKGKRFTVTISRHDGTREIWKAQLPTTNLGMEDYLTATP